MRLMAPGIKRHVRHDTCVDTFGGVTFVFRKGALGPGYSYARSEPPSRLIVLFLDYGYPQCGRGKTKPRN